jgi:hypothetical protein
MTADIAVTLDIAEHANGLLYASRIVVLPQEPETARTVLVYQRGDERIQVLPVRGRERGAC